MAAAKDAGITQIDYLITSHYHGDHIGGLPEFATRIPIRHFIDHGANVQPGPAIDRCCSVTRSCTERHRTRSPSPGKKFPSPVSMSASSRRPVRRSSPLCPERGRPTAYCATFKSKDVARSEDDQSVGTHVNVRPFPCSSSGRFAVEQEFELMCPANRIGDVDLWVVSRHGSRPRIPRCSCMRSGRAWPS
jgi:hypothetical protein